jgi:hypothetical protein
MAAALGLATQVGGAGRDVAFAWVHQQPQLELGHAEAAIAVYDHAAKALALGGDPA